VRLSGQTLPQPAWHLHQHARLQARGERLSVQALPQSARHPHLHAHPQTLSGRLSQALTQPAWHPHQHAHPQTLPKSAPGDGPSTRPQVQQGWCLPSDDNQARDNMRDGDPGVEEHLSHNEAL